MPAPNTSTLVMPDVEPSGLMPSPLATAVPTTAATRSAKPMTTSGTSHSTGERYVTISSRATTAAVTASSVMLAPENEFAMSAPNAGPPVTSVRRSSGKPSAALCRSALTASPSANPVRSAFIGTTATAAAPSADTWAGHFWLDRIEVGGAQRRAVTAGDDDDGRDAIAAGELGPHGVGARRLRGVGNGHRGPGRGIVRRRSAPCSATETPTTTKARIHETRRDMTLIFQLLNN